MRREEKGRLVALMMFGRWVGGEAGSVVCAQPMLYTSPTHCMLLRGLREELLRAAAAPRGKAICRAACRRMIYDDQDFSAAAAPLLPTRACRLNFIVKRAGELHIHTG